VVTGVNCKIKQIGRYRFVFFLLTKKKKAAKPAMTANFTASIFYYVFSEKSNLQKIALTP
jgi:hypothetical protein